MAVPLANYIHAMISQFVYKPVRDSKETNFHNLRDTHSQAQQDIVVLTSMREKVTCEQQPAFYYRKQASNLRFQPRNSGDKNVCSKLGSKLLLWNGTGQGTGCETITPDPNLDNEQNISSGSYSLPMTMAKTMGSDEVAVIPNPMQ
jgi:hypothetical protein